MVLDGFAGAIREPNGDKEWIDWVSADERSSFQVTWSKQHVRVDCRGLDKAGMNQIVDVGIALECPLFDPQVSERFG
jgi:hypothetical protein